MMLVFMANTAFGQVIVTGKVPDETSKAGILAPLHLLYGANNVIDQIEIAPVVLPANWNNYVQKLINPKLKQVSHGQLKIDGTTVFITGEVQNELQRQQMASDIATQLDDKYTLHNGLTVALQKQTEQQVIDTTLGKRIVEFDTGKASLTTKGSAILDELSAPLAKMNYQKLMVIGHTDSVGLRSNNLSLSEARAEVVKSYLQNKGINASKIEATGKGPDVPVASNANPEGRARNRRIEFRIVP
jgi:OOP family OmpA-OmpF porin